MEDRSMEVELPVRQSFFQQLSTFVHSKVFSPNSKLWQHQKDCLRAVVSFFENKQSETALVCLPTGSGKSLIACLLPFLLQSKRVLVVTPSIVITNQLLCDFNGTPSIYERRGIITSVQRFDFIVQANYLESAHSIVKCVNPMLVIANAQRINSPKEYYKKLDPNTFDLVIVDEAHHCRADTWKDILTHFQYSNKVFLTATPSPGGIQVVHSSKIAVLKTREELVNAGVIRDIQFIEVGQESDSKEQIFNSCLVAMKNHLQDGKAFVITKTAEEADAIANGFSLQGFNSKSHHTKKTSNHNTISQFEKGEIKCLVICGQLIEGYDHADITVCVVLKPIATDSNVLFTQFCGRCVRKSNTNDQRIGTIISHVSFKQSNNFESLKNGNFLEQSYRDEQEGLEETMSTSLQDQVNLIDITHQQRYEAIEHNVKKKKENK